jgi:uncharacterized protein DUF2188
MAKAFHVVKQEKGWAVTTPRSRRASSIHATQAEAAAAGRRLALKSGGAEVVIHGTDGRIRQSDTVGAAALDELKRTGMVGQPPTPRAARAEGPRTTLRVPEDLAAVADRMAAELGISRNDALVRLAARGARQYEMEERVALRRAERWAAVVPGVVDVDGLDLPSPEEARAAIYADDDQAR